MVAMQVAGGRRGKSEIGGEGEARGGDGDGAEKPTTPRRRGVVSGQRWLAGAVLGGLLSGSREFRDLR